MPRTICITPNIEKRKKNTKSYRRHTQLKQSRSNGSIRWLTVRFLIAFILSITELRFTLSYHTKRDCDKKKVWLTDPLLSRRPIIDIQGERQLPYKYLRFTSAIYLLTIYSMYGIGMTDYSCGNEYCVLKGFKNAATAAALHIIPVRNRSINSKLIITGIYLKYNSIHNLGN